MEGGSTITQQLAKNLCFTQEKLLTRKVAEVFAAFALEREYSKEEILELYVNSIYFGNGYYSVREASIGYFQKEPSRMTPSECTMLAGIPNAPSAYALTASPELAPGTADSGAAADGGYRRPSPRNRRTTFSQSRKTKKQV